MIDETKPTDAIPSAIETRNLRFRYLGAETDALRGINYAQRRGEFVGMMGRSGAGKSTFCRCLSRLIPRFQRGKLSGSIRIEGESISGKSVADVARVEGSGGTFPTGFAGGETLELAVDGAASFTTTFTAGAQTAAQAAAEINAAAALSVTGSGAQESMPERHEIEELLAS